MIYILYGPDDFSLREKLAELKRGWGDEESLAFNTTILEGRHLALAQLVNECSATPFLGEKRLVIVEGLLSRFEQKTGGSASALDEWKGLTEYVPGMPTTTILLLVDGKIGDKNPLIKGLRPISKVLQFLPPKGRRLHEWMDSRVAKCGGEISAQAMRQLTDLAGENLWTLANEIDKLCLYVRDRPIEVEDVRQATSYGREVSVFPLVDAIVERRVSTAMKLMHQSFDEGMSATYLLFMLARQLRLMVRAHELSEQGVSLAEKREQLGVSAKYPIDRLLEQSSGYSMPRLIEVYRKLVETDVAIKTGKWKDELALDLLVAEVCS